MTPTKVLIQDPRPLGLPENVDRSSDVEACIQCSRKLGEGDVYCSAPLH